MLNNIILSDANNSVDNNDLFVFFKLNEKVYAIHTSHTIEVLKLPMIEYPEKLPNHIIGLLNYNNLTINVIDLRIILNLELRESTVQSQLMVVKTHEALFAILTDEVLDVKSIPASDMQLTPYTSSNNIIKMLYQDDATIVSIIDLYSVEKILKDNEFTENRYDYVKFFPQDEKSKAILNRRSLNLTKKADFSPVQSAYNQEQFVLFNLDNNIYCINIKFVKELVKFKNISITILPFVPSYIEGVINLRGEFTTIINLKEFLHLNNKHIKSKGLIVLQSKEYKIAILADEIYSIENIDNDKLIHKASGKFDSKYVMAEIVKDDKVYNILNVEKILNDEKLYIKIDNIT